MSSQSAIQALQEQQLLLRMEYATEKQAFEKQTELIGMERRVKRGDAWFPIRAGRTYYNSLNQYCIEIFRQEDTDVEHNFEYGRPVAFFRKAQCTESTPVDPDKAILTKGGKKTNNSRLRHFNFTGTVSYAEQDRMVVVIPEGHALDLQNCADPLGVQLSFDETSYRTMFDALDRVIRAKGNRLAYLRDLFYTPIPAKTFGFEPIRFPWLNSSQEKAVNEVLRAKDVAIVHGPPGTGKTTTLVEAINETLMRESQVLVCAQSNMAVDWISEQLVDRGVNVLRIGNPTRVNDKMLNFTYERRFEAHPDYPQLWAIRKTIRELRGKRSGSSENRHQKIERLKSRATELELRIQTELFDQARVIACTLVGSASRILEGRRFATLFIDEAAQALEAACWIPMRRVSRVILAGDHCQLPPTVKSMAALRAGLGRTLMERIADNKPEVVTLLGMQYRMNDDIMQFSSREFYHGKVVSAPQVEHRSILDFDLPMQWIDTDEEHTTADIPDSTSDAEDTSQGTPAAIPANSTNVPDTQKVNNDRESLSFHEQFVGENFGRVNKGEAELTLKTLQDYITKISKQRMLDERIDIGVISPYRAQVQYLRHLVKKREFFKPFRHLITIATVDGFQGQERDVIIISLVRSNENGEIGFLRDLRRMNVAITRARMKLIILGSVSTLTRHPFYKRLWDYVCHLSQVHG